MFESTASSCSSASSLARSTASNLSLSTLTISNESSHSSHPSSHNPLRQTVGRGWGSAVSRKAYDNLGALTQNNAGAKRRKLITSPEATGAIEWGYFVDSQDCWWARSEQHLLIDRYLLRINGRDWMGVLCRLTKILDEKEVINSSWSIDPTRVD